MNAKFENHAREQLGVHEVSVDTDALWANIQPHVQPQNGYKKTVWVFLLGLMLGLTAFGVYYINNNSSSITESNTAAAPLKNSNELASSATITSEQSVEEEIVSTLKTEKGTTPNSTNTVSSDNATNLAATANNKTTKEASKSQKDLAFNNAKSSNKSYSNSKAKANVNSNAKDVASSFITQDQIDAPVSTNNQVTISDQVIVNANTSTDANDAGNENLVVISKSIADQAAKQLPTLLPTHLNSEKELPTNFLNGYKFLSGNVAAANQKKKRKGAFFRDLKFGLGLYTGVSSSAADLEAKDESAAEYLILRTNSEKQLESLHFGFNAIIETDQSIYLRTGAEYTRIGSLFSRASQQVVMDSVPGIVEIQINEVTGDSIFIEGQVLRTTTTKFTKKSYNYFHQVDVPIIFGYNFGSSDDSWRIGVEAGVYANVLLQRKGEISLADGEFYDIKEDSNKWYKNNIGFSPYLGINTAYNVNENIQVHFTPNFRFKSIYTTDDSLIKERHASLGVKAGVRFFFD